jgi:ComF family protein
MPASALLNLLFPPQCLSCDALVPTHGTLCLTCWQKVSFITEPFCACCGLPFEFALGDGALCGECLREHPPFSRARAALRYDEHSKSLILKLKYHDQSYLSRIYGAWLAKAGAEMLAASDVIVPVPLHYWRFVSRRYNQSALLAQSLSKACGLPCLPDGLLRTRKTASQAGLTRAQRFDNVRGAFTANRKHAAKLAGKSVLLVDDVMTTGATLEQCCKALLKAGASTVNVLTLARTV